MQSGAGEVAQQATVHAPKPDNLSLGPVQYMVGKQLRSSPDAHLQCGWCVYTRTVTDGTKIKCYQ